MIFWAGAKVTIDLALSNMTMLQTLHILGMGMPNNVLEQMMRVMKCENMGRLQASHMNQCQKMQLAWYVGGTDKK